MSPILKNLKSTEICKGTTFWSDAIWHSSTHLMYAYVTKSFHVCDLWSPCFKFSQHAITGPRPRPHPPPSSPLSPFPQLSWIKKNLWAERFWGGKAASGSQASTPTTTWSRFIGITPNRSLPAKIIYYSYSNIFNRIKINIPSVTKVTESFQMNRINLNICMQEVRQTQITNSLIDSCVIQWCFVGNDFLRLSELHLPARTSTTPSTTWQDHRPHMHSIAHGKPVAFWGNNLIWWKVSAWYYSFAWDRTLFCQFTSSVCKIGL